MIRNGPVKSGLSWKWLNPPETLNYKKSCCDFLMLFILCDNYIW